MDDEDLEDEDEVEPDDEPDPEPPRKGGGDVVSLDRFRKH